MASELGCGAKVKGWAPAPAWQGGSTSEAQAGEGFREKVWGYSRNRPFPSFVSDRAPPPPHSIFLADK